MKNRLKGLLALVLSLTMLLSMVTVGWGSVNAQGIHVCDTTDCLVCDVAARINALPAAADITVDNAAAVTEQIHAIDRVKVDLTDAQYDELLTVVATRPNGSGYGLAEPARYMEAVEKVTSLNAGGSLAVGKSYSVGSAQLDWTKTDATLSIECLDAGSTFVPLSVTLADIEEPSLAGFYSTTADGWTNRYILPAGTYKITETGYNAVTASGEVLTTTASYEVDGQTTTDYAVVTVEEGESHIVSVLNEPFSPVKIGEKKLSATHTPYWLNNGTYGTETNWNAKLAYDPMADVYTLTLKDFTYDGTEIGISADVGLTIVLEGNNTITSTSDCGILVFGNLIINGTDVLTATGNSFGIKADGNITINSGIVTANGKDAIAIDEYNTTGTVTIDGGNTKVTANGENSGIYAKGSVTISSGEVTAKATENDSWGIYGGNNVTIEDGAKVTANANDDGGVGIGTNYSTNSASSGNSIVISGDNTEVTVGCKRGLGAYEVSILENSKVTVDSATTSAIDCDYLHFADSTYTNSNWYQWTADSNPVQISSDSNQLGKIDAATAKFLKIEKVTPVPTTYTISFNANGGTGTMADVVGVSGSYTLPANGFTPPAGKEFKVWDVDGTEYAAGATINVTANTTVKAVWQDSGNQGGGYPGIPGGFVPTVTPTTPTETIKTESANTFDGGIALSVAMTILTATGSVVLAKKRED